MMSGHREVWDSVMSPSRICNANNLFGGNCRSSFLPLVRHGSPTFDDLFYCSVHLSMDFFPQESADRSKNTFILQTFPKGKHVLNKTIFISFLCERVIRWLPRGRVHVSPQQLSSLLPSTTCWNCTHNPKGCFCSTRTVPGGFSDFHHAVSRATIDLRFQTLPEMHILLLFCLPYEKDICEPNFAIRRLHTTHTHGALTSPLPNSSGSSWSHILYCMYAPESQKTLPINVP